MYPVDPAETVTKQSKSPMAPPYVDEDVNQELVDIGMSVAEDEKREEFQSDSEGEEESSSELRAIREFTPPDSE